jgi:di/tricarboxylate transporter
LPDAAKGLAPPHGDFARDDWHRSHRLGVVCGNLTMIGSTANFVAIGVVERQKIGHIAFGQWLKPGAFVSIQTLLLVTALIYLQFYV